MDLRICENLLEADDILYGSGTCGNAGITGFQSHFPRYGGYSHGTAGGAFCLYIGFSVGNVLISQISNYFANKISISVDNAIKADIFEKMLLTDLESIQNYHTGDLLTRWSSDASNISSGVLNWIPNLVIYTVRVLP